MTKGVGDEMEVTSSQNGSSAFPPKWSVCVQCKVLPKTKDVVALPCLHICCSKDCVNRLFDFDSPCCPECYQKTDRDMLNECSYLSENIVEESDTPTVSKPSTENQICRSCVRESPAIRWCVDCVEFLCSHCTEHHKFGKLTRSHHLAPTSEGIIELEDDVIEGMSPDRKCSLHTKEDLDQFCETCKAALCKSCTMSGKHTSHSIKTLEQLANEFQKEFHSGIETLKTIQEKSEIAVKALDAKLKTVLTEQKTYLHTEARSFFKRLIDALLNREMQLRKDLVEATLCKAKELNIKKAKASSLIKQCTQYIDSAKEIADKGNRWNILHQEHSIRKQYKELSAAHSILTEPEKFDDFVEKDFAFVIEELPVRMAENWISKICQPVYKNTKYKTPGLSAKPSQDEIPMDVDENVNNPTKVTQPNTQMASNELNKECQISTTREDDEKSTPGLTTAAQTRSPNKTKERELSSAEIETSFDNSLKERLNTRKSSRYPLRKTETKQEDRKASQVKIEVEKTTSRPDENFKTVTTRSSRSGKYKS